jgi:predicted ArsR family transcriptional regulator
MVEGPIRPLGKKYSAEILTATAEPRSARELSEHLDIPIATSYRRIEELREAGLLALDDRVRSAGGRRTKVYRRDVAGISIEFAEGEVKMSLEDRSPETETETTEEGWRAVTD